MIPLHKGSSIATLRLSGAPTGPSTASAASASRGHVPKRVADVVCMAGGGKSGRRKAKRPGQFEVKVISPPPRSLGVHVLPPDTHNGDQIEVDGSDYVVSGVVLQYKLVRGRYEREHNRLEVQSTGRYITNAWLQHLLDSPTVQR